MSTTQDTDLLLVNRAGNSHSVQVKDMSTLNDTDLLLVNRNNKSYKVEYKDLAPTPPVPPSIDFVMLTEDDPEGDRFTSQNFTASSSIVDGYPLSTKTIDAYVDGNILEVKQFAAPLRSTTLETYDFTTSMSGNWKDQEFMYDGDMSTFSWYRGGGNTSGFFDVQNSSAFPGGDEGKGYITVENDGIGFGVWLYCDPTINSYGFSVIDADGNSMVTPQQYQSYPKPLDPNEPMWIGIRNSGGGYIYGNIRSVALATFTSTTDLDGTAVHIGAVRVGNYNGGANGGKITNINTTVLNFDSGVDIDDLIEPGDVVTQGDLNGVVDSVGVWSSVAPRSITLTEEIDGWVIDEDVVGPEKEVLVDNTRKYLEFDSDGNVSTLLDAPQDPAYTTTETNPGIQFKFPAMFPSGDTPDETLGEGTTLTVSYTAENSSASVGPSTAVVQPAGAGGLGPPLTGLTTLYYGQGSEQSIFNGVDNSGTGGMIIEKDRTTTSWFWVHDTNRGPNSVLFTNKDSDAQAVPPLHSFLDNGFTLVGGNDGQNNRLNNSYVAWNFGKAEQYFDIVTYTGNGNQTGDGGSGLDVPHSLGTKPGFIMIKSPTLNGGQWLCYHHSIGPQPNTNTFLSLNTENLPVEASGGDMWGAITDTYFNVGRSGGNIGDNHTPNGGGVDYVAYLFPEDSPYCKADMYPGNSQTAVVTTGFKPQWVMIKNINDARSWAVFDDKRGGEDRLSPNNDSTTNPDGPVTFTETGFTVGGQSGTTNVSGNNFVYIAIAAPVQTSMTQEQFAAFNTSMDEYPMKECVGHLQMEMERTGTTIWEIAARLADDDYDD